MIVKDLKDQGEKFQKNEFKELEMDRNSEIKEKERRVREFLEKKGLGGVLLCRQDNFAWFMKKERQPQLKWH